MSVRLNGIIYVLSISFPLLQCKNNHLTLKFLSPTPLLAATSNNLFRSPRKMNPNFSFPPPPTARTLNHSQIDLILAVIRRVKNTRRRARRKKGKSSIWYMKRNSNNFTIWVQLNIYEWLNFSALALIRPHHHPSASLVVPFPFRRKRRTLEIGLLTFRWASTEWFFPFCFSVRRFRKLKEFHKVTFRPSARCKGDKRMRKVYQDSHYSVHV